MGVILLFTDLVQGEQSVSAYNCEGALKVWFEDKCEVFCIASPLQLD